MRCIYADKLKDIKFNSISNDKYGIYRMGWNDAIDAVVDNEPTADVVERSSYESMEHTVAKLNEALSNSVEVVRCKDCIYRFGSLCKWREDETPDPDDYCSIGEKL